MTSTSCIHPIFEKCMQYTLDEYWRDVFASCAENKFPPGVRYNPSTHTLYVKKDTKKASPIGLPEEPVDVFKRMMKVFRNDCEMSSSRDIEIQKEDLEDMQKQCTIDLNCDWKKIKPRYLKEQLIFEYVGKLKITHSLNPAEVRKLLSIIQLGFQFKQLTADDIDYSCGVIDGIDGIEFDVEKRSFYIDRPQRNASTKTERNAKPTKFNQSCDRFLKEYQKRFRPSTIN